MKSLNLPTEGKGFVDFDKADKDIARVDALKQEYANKTATANATESLTKGEYKNPEAMTTKLEAQSRVLTEQEKGLDIDTENMY